MSKILIRRKWQLTIMLFNISFVLFLLTVFILPTDCNQCYISDDSQLLLKGGIKMSEDNLEDRADVLTPQSLRPDSISEGSFGNFGNFGNGPLNPGGYTADNTDEYSV